ncbi:MAG: DUF2069 domain-containing protein [Halothiobacillaceae bacterium]
MKPRLISALHCALLVALAIKGFALTQGQVGHPGALLTLILLIPGLAVLPGLLRKRPNTIVWTALVSLLYLTIAITDAWSLDTLRLANLTIALLCCAVFILAWAHLRALRQARLARTNNS